MLIGQLKSRLSLNKTNKAVANEQLKENTKVEPAPVEKEENQNAAAIWFVEQILSCAKEQAQIELDRRQHELAIVEQKRLDEEMAHIKKMAELRITLDQEIEQENMRIVAEKKEKEKIRLELEAAERAQMAEEERLQREVEEKLRREEEYKALRGTEYHARMRLEELGLLPPEPEEEGSA